MRVIRTLSWIELKLFVREPVTVVFTLALPPLVLYVLAQVFGNTPDPTGQVYGGAGPLDFYTPACIGMVIASLRLIGLPVHIASCRERGVLRRFQAARVPARAIVLAQLGTLFAAVPAGGVILVALARPGYGVRWPASWWAVCLAVVVGTFAFAAIGVFLGAVLPTARAARGIGVLLWFRDADDLRWRAAARGAQLDAAAHRRLHAVAARADQAADAWLGRGVKWTQMLILVAVLVVCAGLATPALRRRA